MEKSRHKQKKSKEIKGKLVDFWGFWARLDSHLGRGVGVAALRYVRTIPFKRGKEHLSFCSKSGANPPAPKGGQGGGRTWDMFALRGGRLGIWSRSLSRDAPTKSLFHKSVRAGKTRLKYARVYGRIESDDKTRAHAFAARAAHGMKTRKTGGHLCIYSGARISD